MQRDFGFEHTHQLDTVGTPVGVQQRLMRHTDIRTMMNVYGTAATEDMRQTHRKNCASCSDPDLTDLPGDLGRQK